MNAMITNSKTRQYVTIDRTTKTQIVVGNRRFKINTESSELGNQEIGGGYDFGMLYLEGSEAYALGVKADGID